MNLNGETEIFCYHSVGLSLWKQLPTQSLFCKQLCSRLVHSKLADRTCGCLRVTKYTLSHLKNKPWSCLQVRKKDQINIETKNKTVRFIGELTKFKMFSKSDTLHCLKVSVYWSGPVPSSWLTRGDYASKIRLAKEDACN